MNKNIKGHLQELEDDLGINFNDKRLLYNAFLHSSYINEHTVEEESNEKLELLGDSVLAFIVIEYLYINHRNATEGELSKIKAVVVSEPTLAVIARKMSLGNYLLLSRGERLSRGMERDSILSDTLEALLGSYFIDKGIEKVREFILPYIIEEVDKVRKNEHKQDYKSRLQHMTQQDFKECPIYNTVSEEGPDHKKTFCVQVLIKGEVIGSGSGNSKRVAQQSAAKDAISRIK